MTVAVIKYNAGNIQSVSYALERLDIEFIATDKWEEISKADKVIFPGVGEARSTMKFLREKKLDVIIAGLKQPVLGICLGMQLMCSHSEENDTPCIGIFAETVLKFNASPAFKVPHVGWNNVHHLSGWFPSDLADKFVYFVHSYYVPFGPCTVATTNYTVPFAAAMKKDNFYAVQFHPEKSAQAGQRVLQSFLEL